MRRRLRLRLDRRPDDLQHLLLSAAEPPPARPRPRVRNRARRELLERARCNVFAALAVLSEAPELPECSTTVLLKTYRTRNRLLEALPPEARVLYGANLGLDNETYSSRRDEIDALPEAYLSMLAVKK